MISSLNKTSQQKGKSSHIFSSPHNSNNLQNLTSGFTTAKLTIRHNQINYNPQKPHQQKNQIDQSQIQNALIQADKLMKTAQPLQAVNLLKTVKQAYYTINNTTMNNTNNNNNTKPISLNWKNKNLFITLCINLAVAYYQVGFLQQANDQLNNVVVSIQEIIHSNKMNQNKLKVHQRIHYQVLNGKIQLQTCILYSQMGKHDMALEHARIACRIHYDLIYETLLGLYIKLNSSLAENKDFIKDPQAQIKIQEHSSLLNNISILTHLIKVTKDLKANFFSKQKAYMLSDQAQFTKKYGKISSRINIDALYAIQRQKDNQIQLLHQIPHAWIYKSKILDQIQLKAIPLKYLDSLRFNITNSDVIQRIIFLAISLYCFSTQTRFLQKGIISDPTDVLDSQHWLSRSLQIAYMFMPPEAPILNQILTVHDRFHGIDKQTIPQDKQVGGFFKVLRPLSKPKSTYSSKSAMCSPILIRIQAQKLTIDLDVNNSTHRQQQSSQSKKFIQFEGSNTLDLGSLTKNNKIRGLNTVNGKQKIMNFMDINTDSMVLGKKANKKIDQFTIKNQRNPSDLHNIVNQNGNTNSQSNRRSSMETHGQKSAQIQNKLKLNFSDLSSKYKTFEQSLKRPHSYDRQIFNAEEQKQRQNLIMINTQRKKKSFSTKKRQIRNRTSSSSDHPHGYSHNGGTTLKLDGFQLMPSSARKMQDQNQNAQTFDLFHKINNEGRLVQTKINGNIFINNNINLFISKDGDQNLQDIIHKKHSHTSYNEISRRQNILNKRKNRD